MKTNAISTILMALSLGAFGTMATIAQTNKVQSPSATQGMKEMSHDHMMMNMANEPHHVLAMAYKDNLMNFAKALREQAAKAKTVDLEFARAAVAEMKRSFDQMQEHHQDHMKTMDETMKTQMADMMKQMDAHHSAIQEHLAALDKEVQTSAPDAKGISTHVAEILKQCDGMAKMHGGSMEHKMAGPKDGKMD